MVRYLVIALSVSASACLADPPDFDELCDMDDECRELRDGDGGQEEIGGGTRDAGTDAGSRDAGTDSSTPGGGTTGGGSTPTVTGACAYYHSQLNRLLCEQRGSTSSCSGKYFGSGTNCLGFSCPQGSTNPQQCTIGGSSGGGTTGGGGGTTGGGGSSLVCGRYQVVDAGSSSSPGSGTILDTSTGYRWNRYSYSPKTQAAAISFCQSIGARLPTKAEAGALSKCCVTTATSSNCNAAFPAVWETWTTTAATPTGNAYYATTPGFTCLPSNCVVPATSNHAVMCVR